MIRPCPSNTLHISSFLQLVLQYELKQCARMLYVCRMNVSLLISGAIAHIKKQIPQGIEIDTDSKRINVYPENVTELKNLLAYLSLSGVHFSESGMEITLDMN